MASYSINLYDRAGICYELDCLSVAEIKEE
jgi:hypothetical protein